MKSKLMCALLAGLLTACTGNVKPAPPVIYAQARVVCDAPVGVDELQLEAVEFHAVQGRLVSGGASQNWIGLTPEGFEALTRNLQRILIQTKQLKAVQDYFQSCIETANKSVTGGSVLTVGGTTPATAETSTDSEASDSKRFWQFWKRSDGNGN